VSIDRLTGTITVSGSTSSDAIVEIIIKTNTGNTFKKESRIIFKWNAPKIGDFAYVDGTFSSYYNSAKTLAGLVYAKTGDDNTGTVYIIGKEYSNSVPHYSGYTTRNANENSDGNAAFIYDTK
jgi:hypothetical protein